MIDDDANSIELAQKFIENVGYNFFGAQSLLKAAEIIKEHSPHLIILDVKLDGEDGFSYLNERERNEVLSRIPVLVLTQMQEEKMLQKVLSYKGADFLQKPIHPSLLLQKIKKNLKTVEPKMYSFNEQTRPYIDVTIFGEIVKISEVAIKVESAIKINQEEEISVKSALLEELKIPSQKMVIKKKSTSGVEGGYDTEVIMLGVTEESAQKIRRIRRVKS